jgi:hypothetical protein
MIFDKIIIGIILSGLVFFCGCITVNVYEGNGGPPVTANIGENMSHAGPAESIPPVQKETTIIPLVKAGTPFDSSVYPQDTPQSDPMAFQCNWSGNGRVYISGNRYYLSEIRADDGYTVIIQPSGARFDSSGRRAGLHPVLELTSGMTPGVNTFTLIVRNWQGLSMSYGSISGVGVDQIPYIVQVND